MSEHSAIPIDEVITLCRRLRLKYVLEQVEEVVLTARAQPWDPTDVLRSLLVAEAQGRDRSTIEVRRQTSPFPCGQDVRHLGGIPLVDPAQRIDMHWLADEYRRAIEAIEAQALVGVAQ